MLGRTAIDGQHTDEPLPPNRPDNLWHPVAGDHGAHGRFDARSRPESAQLTASLHRNAIAAAIGAVAIAGLLWRRRLR